MTKEDFLIHVIDGGTSYEITKADFQKALSTGFLGGLATADVPTADGVYIAEEAGTYTNAGGLVVSLTNEIAYIAVGENQTTFELIEVTSTSDSAYANVIEYGAVGNGTTDDTTSIQNALDNPDNKPVLIPFGAYLISDSLIIPSNCQIINYGTLKRDTGEAAFDMLVGDSVDNVIIRGGKIDGVALLDVSVAANRFCGIRFYDSNGTSPCTNILVENVEVTNTTHGEVQAEGNRGAITLEDTINGVVDGCRVYGNRGSSILMHGKNSKDCKVINCYAYDNDQIGSGITGNGYTGLIVDNNHCYNTKYTPISVNGKGAIISNNTVYNAPDNMAGITIGHNSPVSNASNTVCTGNVIRDCGKTKAFVAGIVVSNSDEVIITGNLIKDNSSRGIRFLGKPVTATGGCRVSDNIIMNNGGHAILMEWGVGHIIENNNIVNNTGDGVYIDGSKLDSGYPLDNIYVRNNFIKNNNSGANGSGIRGAGSTATNYNIWVHGNTFISNGKNQLNAIWSAHATVTIHARNNEMNENYGESLAFRSTSGGKFT
jgi:parallel beta-helix repeat protein